MLGNTIMKYRKNLGLTQEQLAQKLEVTNQAVSKWETDQCCPDVQLLPKLADVLGISLDTLFGREASAPQKQDVPWKDDDAFHIVLYCGHTLLESHPAAGEHQITYDGPARDVYCAVNLECGDIEGNVEAGGYVECSDIEGNVKAGGYVECGDVGGDLNAMSYVECGDVGGNLNAASYVECGDVGGNVNAMSYVECSDVEGNVVATSYVECGDVGGNVSSGD